MDKEKMPAGQILVYVLKKAQKSLSILKNLEAQWLVKRSKQEDASCVREEQMIILDAFTMYIASLVDKTGGTHSLVRSYKENVFIKQFQDDPVVRSCVEHRNNRAGHQSEYYGSVVPLESVLASDLETLLKNLFFLVRQFEEK